MARCKDCIHEKVCMNRANIQTDTYAYMGVKYYTEKCEHYITADVVPKSEVEREYGNALQTAFNDGRLEGGKEVAREIFEEIEKITMHNVTSSYGIWLMSMGEDAFAKLKKKYIGEIKWLSE